MAKEIDPITGLEALEKQPSESRIYTFDFSSLLAQNIVKTVLSVTQINQNLISGSSDLTLGSPTTNLDKLVQIRILGGTDDEDYKITALIEDTGSNILEGEGLLRVRDL